MVDLNEIEREIINLESKDTTFAVVERLAWLYTVRDHLAPQARTGDIVGGEFARICSDVPINALMAVLGEHMDAIRVLYPGEYNAVIERIKALK